MDTMASMGIEYNPETVLAKAGLRVGEKEVKKQIKHFIKGIKAEITKTTDYFNLPSLSDITGEIIELKDEAMDIIQEASQYGIASVINRPLQIIKSMKDLSNSIFHPTGDSKSAKIIDELQKAGIQSVSVVMPEGAFENKPVASSVNPVAASSVNPVAMPQNPIMANPMAQKMMMNPMAQRMVMRGGKREKDTVKEIEETLSMLINHKLWLLNQIKTKGSKSKTKRKKHTKKHTIKKKKMIKNPKKKGTKRRKGSKRR